MKDWFASLEPRERVMVSTGTVVVLFAVFWYLLWVPLDNGQRAAAERVSAWQQGLAALGPLSSQMATAGTDARPTMPDQSLVVIVDNTLRQRGLYNALQRSQPTPGNDGIRVEFENAAFDDLVLWLGDLHSRHGLNLQSGSFSVASGDNPGRVNSSVTLER